MFCTQALLVLLAVLSTVLPSCDAGEQPKGKNVLVLVGANRADNRRLLDLVEAEMRVRIPGSITFYDRYLTTNLDKEKYSLYQDSQAETFRRTYAEMNLNLVIAVYPQGVEFATRYLDQIFPNVPMIFTGIGIKGLVRAGPWGEKLVSILATMFFTKRLWN